MEISILGLIISMSAVLISVVATNPSCTLQENDSAGILTSVTVTCSISTLSSKAKCEFYRYKDDKNQGTSLAENIDYEHNQAAPGDSFSSTCSMIIPIGQWGPGTFNFYATMYPDVDGGESQGVDATPASIELKLPVALIYAPASTKILNGYVKGQSVRIRCAIEDHGKPRALRVRWFHTDGTEIEDNGPLSESYYTFSVNSARPVCKVVSALGETQPWSFDYDFAYIDTVGNSVIGYIEEGQCTHDDDMTVVCRLNKTQANPEPTNRISVDDMLTWQEPEVVGSFPTVWDYRLNITRARSVRVYCQYTNTIFSELWRTSFRDVETFEPPSRPPSLGINQVTFVGTNSSNAVTVIAGEKVAVSCGVDDGYPATDFILKCGVNKAEEFTGTRTVSQVFTEESDGRKCDCVGLHRSACYEDNESEATLTVLYKPKVVFTAGNEEERIYTVNGGDDVELTCTSEANPNPSMTLERQNTGQNTVIEQFHGNSRHVTMSHPIPSISCEHMGLYLCVSRNDVGLTESSISIFVQCPFSQDDSLSSAFSSNVVAIKGKDGIFRLRLMGYPDPTTYILKKGYVSESSNASRGDAFDSLPSATVEYEETIFREETSPFVDVNITMRNLMEDDFGGYTLAVSNEIGGNQDYVYFQFSVTEETDNGGGDSGIDTIIIIVIACGGVVAIAAIIAVILFVRRIANRKRQETNQNTGPAMNGGRRGQPPDYEFTEGNPGTGINDPISTIGSVSSSTAGKEIYPNPHVGDRLSSGYLTILSPDYHGDSTDVKNNYDTPASVFPRESNPYYEPDNHQHPTAVKDKKERPLPVPPRQSYTYNEPAADYDEPNGWEGYKNLQMF